MLGVLQVDVWRVHTRCVRTYIRMLHCSFLSALSLEDDCRHISLLINTFITRVSCGREVALSHLRSGTVYVLGAATFNTIT